MAVVEELLPPSHRDFLSTALELLTARERRRQSAVSSRAAARATPRRGQILARAHLHLYIYVKALVHNCNTRARTRGREENAQAARASCCMCIALLHD